MVNKVIKGSLIGLFFVLLVVAVSLNSNDNRVSKQWALYNDGKLSDESIDKESCLLNKSMAKAGVDLDIINAWTLLETHKKVERSVVVAILDTGIDFENDELKGKGWINKAEIPNNHCDDDKNGYIDDYYGWDFVNMKPLSQNVEYSDHGTACAGIIGGEIDGRGISGVAGSVDLKIMPLKIISDQDESAAKIPVLIKAIKYAENNGADICNLSVGTEIESSGLYNTIKKSKMLFVDTAGNCAGPIQVNIDKKKWYPASYNTENKITVSSIGFDGRSYVNANRGNNSIDVLAPGVNIYCVVADNRYEYYTGTSFATPFVTGLAALLYAYSNDIDAEEAKRIIIDSAKETAAHKDITSKKMISASSALKMLFDKKGGKK